MHMCATAKSDMADGTNDGAAENQDRKPGVRSRMEEAAQTRVLLLQELRALEERVGEAVEREWAAIEERWGELQTEREVLEVERAQVQREREEVEADRAEVERERERRGAEGDDRRREGSAVKRQRVATPSNRVKLDIGGQVFTTSVATLQQYSSHFRQLLAGNWVDRAEEDGSVFVDRDPAVFRHILNFMRGVPIPTDQLTPAERRQVEMDVEFYGIQSLQAKVGPIWKEFPYMGEAKYDNKGIIYFIATRGGRQAWVNPQATGLVTVTTSQMHCGSASAVVANACQEFGVNHGQGNWVVIDLHGRRVRPRAYVISHTSGLDGYYYLRNWQLQGTADGETWTTLKSHTADKTLDYGRSTGGWALDSGDRWYTMFRILQTGPDSSDYYYLMFSGFEIYGYLETDTDDTKPVA